MLCFEKKKKKHEQIIITLIVSHLVNATTIIAFQNLNP